MAESMEIGYRTGLSVGDHELESGTLVPLLFSKHVAGSTPEELAAEMLSHGLGALDLTVRRGGHVEPQDARDALPELFDRFAASGIRVGMLTTNVTDAGDALTQSVLETAARLGIRHYKLGYWRYERFGSLRRQKAEVAAKLADIASLSLELGLTAGFHNHSHDFVGASLWDVADLLAGLPAEAVVAYLDPAHAAIEGGGSGWRMGMEALGDRIGMLAVKDYRWVDGKHRYGGGRRHSVEFCPLEEGNTPWPEVLRHLAEIGFTGPVSFHSEYQGPHSFTELSWRQVVAQTAEDVAAFRRWLDENAAGDPGD